MSAVLAVLMCAIGVLVIAGTVATNKKNSLDTVAATARALQFIPIAWYGLVAYLIWQVAR